MERGCVELVCCGSGRMVPRTLGFGLLIAGIWSAGNDGMEKKIETTTMGYIGNAIRIHFFIPS